MVKKSKSIKTNSKLIQSQETSPKVTLKPGMRFEVVNLSLVDSNLSKAKPLAARLCGGTTTCLALIDIAPSKVGGT